MKRLAVFDFDGTLFNSPEKEIGKQIWKEKTGQDYPYAGWWGRKESLDTNVFDIRPFPNVLAQLNREKSTPDTQVIILTSRMEKLRPEVENILNMYNVVVDDVILKKGNMSKGEVLLKIDNYNPDLREIIVYDDFMNRNAEKIAEYTNIKDQLSDDIKYILMYVHDDTIKPLIGEGRISFESTNKLLNIIQEEIIKFK